MTFTDHYTTSQDGLRLHARRWGAELPNLCPVVCLPGLSRNTADFEDIARALVRADDRAVYAFDYRGRGLSDYDTNWKNYDLKVEIVDILDQLTALGIQEAIFFGTSRGGLHSMLIGMMRPAAIKGVILNDIGPIIDGKGLARIKSYVGKLPQPRDFDEAASILKSINKLQFPALTPEEWLIFARRTWNDVNGKLVPAYDASLLKTLELVDLEAPLPVLWPQFNGLAHVPVLVLRGENSDLLSAETVREMVERHPDCILHEVPDQGHTPLLMDPQTQQAVIAFVRRAESTVT